ncbi:HAD-IIB family hydrolase [[Limnothrix rosea] IAM M-220]|uniref:HAD-IIB family hydrolase n=1 Tax=[Limnothrix rosea] IAM M-220 TaxID=454133 RepID=UPI00096959F9|nr:HAD-IIB family hydrolase [[Limnothrix rosea] IAM M-220]OKH18116.1 HAD family hydrolase [[Limnothrix rosea] IAM M-220]
MFLCFTDLDGTLLNHDDYQYDDAVPTLKKLRSAGVPVIPTTSKTKAEVSDLRAALGLGDPFIVENGSGVFFELNDTRFDFQQIVQLEKLSTTVVANLDMLTLGVTYEEARQGLQQLSEQTGETLRGFGDLTVAELEAATGLSAEAIQQACDRQFSEPFVRPETSMQTLEAIAQELGFKILVGNRFCHLLGAGAAKGRAVQLVAKAWQLTHDGDEKITTVGLGDSPNDLSLLEAVDVAIVVPGIKGAHPDLIPFIEKYGWQVAPDTGCRGWSGAVEAAIAQHLS